MARQQRYLQRRFGTRTPTPQTIRIQETTIEEPEEIESYQNYARQLDFSREDAAKQQARLSSQIDKFQESKRAELKRTKRRLKTAYEADKPALQARIDQIQQEIQNPIQSNSRLQRLQNATQNAVQSLTTAERKYSRLTPEQKTRVRQERRKDYRSDLKYGLGETSSTNVNREIREAVSQSYRTPGIYRLSTGATIVTQAQPGTYRNQRGQVIRIREGAVGSNFPQQASESVPLRQRPSQTRQRRPRQEAGVTNAIISNVTQGSRVSPAVQAQIRRERELTRQINRAIERQIRSEERSQRSKDIFRAVPGLRGDNYAQRFTRSALALPTTLTFGFGAALAGTFVDNPRIAAQSYRVNPRATRRELRQGLRDTPRSIARGFDPRDPEGLLNLGLVGAGGALGVRGAMRSPTRAGQSLGVTKAVSRRGRTVVSEQVRLPGVLNRALDRRATVTTQQLPSGTVTRTLRSQSGLRITDTFRPSEQMVSRTVRSKGQSRRFQSRLRRPSSEELVIDLIGRPKKLRQTNAENLQPGILAQEVVDRVTQNARITYRGVTRPGRAASTSRAVSRSELDPTQIIRRVQARNRGGLIEAFETETFQRPLRPGERTSRGESIQLTGQPIIDLNRGIFEQSSALARTPRPRTITRQQQAFRVTSPRVPRRKLPSGRLGRRGQTSSFVFEDLIQQLRRPVRVARPEPPVFGGARIGVPQIQAFRFNPVVGFLPSAVLAATGRQSSRGAVQSSQRGSQYFQFDIGPAQGQSARRAQQQRQSQTSLLDTTGRVRTSSPGTSPSTPGVPQNLFRVDIPSSPGLSLFPPVPNFGQGRDTPGGYRSSKRAKREYRYTPDLFSMLFNIRAPRGSKKRLQRQTFTGLEIRPLV